MKNRVTPQWGLNVLCCSGRLPCFGALALISLLALSSHPANAQVAFGSMVGNVTDASGSAIPGASVKITMTQTNDSRTIETSELGSYTISTVTPGTYQIEITRDGFRSFVAPNVLVNPNNVVRVDAQLQIGAVSERVEVEATAAALQTDRADIHAEVTSKELIDLPQPNRTYSGLLALVPGTTPPAGQLQGGTNNPSKSMTFSFNGTGTSASTVRIEGVNALNFWNTSAQSFVPSVEAIQTVNVATNAQDAEQGLSAGASVNVQLKSGTNELHGGTYWYNSTSATQANSWFANAQPNGPKKPPHLVLNNAGGFLGGRVIKDKLFYFGSYEGDFSRSAESGILSIPAAKELSGDLSGSANPIYDPATGTPDGRNRTPFANNRIPQNRIDPVIKRIIPSIPATNIPGASVNNFYMDRAVLYNLHKIDSKVDYTPTNKLRLSARWGKQPYYNTFQPIYGEVLGGSGGFPQSGAGNYLQNGAATAWSGSGTYVASPSLVIDATFGYISSHQILLPNKANERYGKDVLGIPGVNIGELPWAGGVPNFELTNFVTMGMSYPALEYIQPSKEFTANVSKIYKSHTIRFGADLTRFSPKHIEIRDNRFKFLGGSTSLNGGPSANQYNVLGDFLLGLPYEMYNWKQVIQPYLTMYTWEFAAYVRDQWQVSRKLTLNYGVRWENYPVPTREGSGMYFYDVPNNTVQVCGVGNYPTDCGIHVSKKIFAPNVGLAYRATPSFVVRAGYSLAPDPISMGRGQMQAFPGEVQLDIIGDTSFTPAGQLSNGIPLIPDPVGTNGAYFIPKATGNLSSLNASKDYVRGYFQTYNITVQKELPMGLVGQVGYVGMHSTHIQNGVNINYGQLGGGSASQPAAKFGNFASISVLEPYQNGVYNSMQATLNRRFANGLTFQSAYTYSKDIQLTTQIRIPEYRSLDRFTSNNDRTHHIVISGSYDLPFGKGKKFAQQTVAAAVLGGWTLNGMFNHWSGVPYTIISSASSCNCPGNTQIADLIKPNVAQVGRGVNGLNDPYFDVTAYAPVTTGARFGTSGFNQLRGPGSNNMDLGVYRIFPITERIKFQLRAEALNATNTPHFSTPTSGTTNSTPTANVSNLQLNQDGSVRNLNGFGQITSTAPLGRIIDQRYFRFGARLTF
jgi:hypothetical protein